MASCDARVTIAKRQSDGRNIASEIYAEYPLRLHICNQNETTKSTNDDDVNDRALSLYVLSHGGGMLHGDSISMKIHVKAGAALCVTSFSTSKAFKPKLTYKSRPAVNGSEQQQQDGMTSTRTECRVGCDALLALCPQPTQCFKDSRLSQENRVRLEADGSSSLFLVDWYTGGRVNLDCGLWQMDLLRTSTNIYISENGEDVNVFRDVANLSGGSELNRHMRGFNVVAMVLLVGSRVKRFADDLLEEYCSRSEYDNGQRKGSFTGEGMNTEGLLVSCGKINLSGAGAGTMLRLCARTVEQAASFMSRKIGDLGGELECDPFLEILQRTGNIHPNAALKAIDIIKPSVESIINTRENGEVDDLGLFRSFDFQKNETSIQMNGEASTGNSFKIKSNETSPMLLFQLIDSSVPTGAFAHSNTIEVAHQLKLVKKCNLKHYIWDVLVNTLSSTIPFLIQSLELFQNVSSKEFDTSAVIRKWLKLDSMLSATMTAQVTRRASIVQGTGMLRSFISSFPNIAPNLKLLKRCIIQNTIKCKSENGHTVTVFGAVCGLLGVSDIIVVLDMLIYMTIRDMVSAAVRLNLIGPLEGCSYTNSISNKGKELALIIINENGTNFGNLDSAHQVAPIVEVVANAHDRLYTRLFNS